MRNETKGAQSATDLVTSLTYDLDGLPLTFTDPAGQVITRTYDGLGRLASENRPTATQSTLLYDYAYDALGRVDTVTAGSDQWQTVYLTGQTRIARAYSPTGTVTYTWDALAEIDTATRGETGVADPVVSTRTYDGRGAILTEHTEVARGFEYDVTWTYGDAGRLTALQVEDTTGSLPVVTRTLDYDGERRRQILGAYAQSGAPLVDYAVELDYVGPRVGQRTLWLSRAQTTVVCRVTIYPSVTFTIDQVVRPPGPLGTTSCVAARTR